MRVFLCDAGNIPQEILKRATKALPKARVPKDDIQQDALAARVVGTLLVIYAIKQISPETVCENWQNAAEGKPFVENCPVAFSITHTGNIVGVAVSEKHPVGLDIEKIRPMRKGFAARYFSKREQAEINAANDPAEALIRLWTAKEAVGKYHGTGLGGNITEIDTQNAVSALFEKNGTRFALSLASKGELPPLEWVDFSELVP